MKKYLFLAVAAVAVLASCSKNQIDPASKKQINFSTVTGMTTKAPLSGTIYKTTDPNFGIFCYALTGTKTWAANSADGQLYMDNVEIAYNSTDLIWEPATTYYWPLSGSLTFVGYSPYGCAGTVAYVPGTKTLTVTDFTVEGAIDDQEDLMWATTNPDLTDNQAEYTPGGGSLLGVNEVFHHALSQVKFAVKKAAGLDDYTLTVNSITFDAYSKGTFTLVNDAITTTTSEGVTSNTNWTAQAKQANFVFNTGGSDVVAPNNSAASFAAFGSANMTVPQALSDGVQTFTITYSLKKGDVNLGSTTVENINLLGAEVKAWLPNTIYTYNIEIGLKKIYFNPTIVDWVTGASQQINVN